MGALAEPVPVTTVGVRRLGLLLPQNRRRVLNESFETFRTEVAKPVLAALTVDDAMTRFDERPFAASILASAMSALHGFAWTAIEQATDDGVGSRRGARWRLPGSAAMYLEHALQTIAVARRTLVRQLDQAMEGGVRVEDIHGRPSFVVLVSVAQRIDVLLTVCLMGAARDVRVRRVAVLTALIHQLYDLSSTYYSAVQTWAADVRALLPSSASGAPTDGDDAGSPEDEVVLATRRRVADLQSRRSTKG